MQSQNKTLLQKENTNCIVNYLGIAVCVLLYAYINRSIDRNVDNIFCAESGGIKLPSVLPMSV